MTFSLAGAERIALVGDSHANLLWMIRTLRLVSKSGISHVVVLGDFGYWPRMTLGREFIDAVAAEALRLKLHVAFLDGNHEDHAALHTAHHKPGSASIVEVVPGLHHLRRGARLHFDTHEIAVCGGAVSVDRAHREPGFDWFPEEAIDDETVQLICSAGPADVLLAHDAPYGALCHSVQGVLGGQANAPDHPGIDARVREDAIEHQRRISRLVSGLGATMIIHGHYHRRYTDTMTFERRPVRVEGVGRDGTWPGDGILVLDARLRLLPSEEWA